MRMAVFYAFAAFSLMLTVPTQSQAKTKFKVLHTFHGKDGAGPDAQMVRDSAGNLYGTTGTGGSDKCQGGCGTAFKMDRYGKLKWQHNFNGADGDTPFPGLLRDGSGNLYGTTIYGGKTSHSCPSNGCGVIFKLDMNGNETILHEFNGVDGAAPVGPLVEDQSGNLYGATSDYTDGGTIFKLDRTRTESVLYRFGCGSDGCDPGAGVTLDAAGNIYGTTFIGGDTNCNSPEGCGVVFQIDTRRSEMVLHTFEASDGADPASGLLLDSAGNLYGTTEAGGNLDCNGGEGCGVVFEMSPQSNGTWTESTLYNFCSLSNCMDGTVPREGPLVRDAFGNLYGSTLEGGNGSTCNAGGGCGVIFELSPNGQENVLHYFTGGTDGYSPLTGVTLEAVS
jgi:uncharacterized repeat protein (TIGR03803 family)